MNEKTPNAQTQAAMTKARAIARNRMPELVETTAGVESLPNFTGAIKGGDLLLVGKCAECHGDVARVIEGS